MVVVWWFIRLEMTHNIHKCNRTPQGKTTRQSVHFIILNKISWYDTIQYGVLAKLLPQSTLCPAPCHLRPRPSCNSTRPRRLIFATRRDRDLARPRPRRFSRPSTFSLVPKQIKTIYIKQYRYSILVYSQDQVIIGLLQGNSSGERKLRVLHCSSWTVWNFGCTCNCR